MGMVAMIRAIAGGMSFWLPMQQIAATFYGSEALLGGFGPTIVGMMIHLMFSAAFGGVVGLFVYRFSAGATFWVGMLAGIIIWAVMTWIVMPVANPVMHQRVALMNGWWFVYHLVFGGMLFLTPLINRGLEHRRVADASHSDLPGSPRPGHA